MLTDYRSSTDELPSQQVERLCNQVAELQQRLEIAERRTTIIVESIRQDEREECAKVVENYVPQEYLPNSAEGATRSVIDWATKAIKERR